MNLDQMQAAFGFEIRSTSYMPCLAIRRRPTKLPALSWPTYSESYTQGNENWPTVLGQWLPYAIDRHRAAMQCTLIAVLALRPND